MRGDRTSRGAVHGGGRGGRRGALGGVRRRRGALGGVRRRRGDLGGVRRRRGDLGGVFRHALGLVLRTQGAEAGDEGEVGALGRLEEQRQGLCSRLKRGRVIPRPAFGLVTGELLLGLLEGLDEEGGD